MMASSDGVPGRLVAGAFLRMACGENALNEKNAALGLVRHKDGWGAVLAQGGKPFCVRRATACWEDAEYEQVHFAETRLLHARLASSGSVAESNVHPFKAVIRGAPWFFCHNGTLHDEPGDGTSATDSERFLRRMTPLLERGDDPISAFESVAGRLTKITALNAFLLGPDKLWAFCVWADCRSRAYYTLSWAATPYGVIVSSEPLRDVAADWTPMENQTAIVLPSRALATRESRPRPVRLRLPASLTPAGA